MKVSLPISLATISLAVFSLASTGQSEEVFSGAAGFSAVAIPANRDAYLSVPISREAPVIGAVTLVGNLDGEGNQRISIDGVSGLTSNELAAAHVVRLLDGPDAGLRFDVVENDAGTILVAFDGNAPSPGSIAALEPAWTLDALLPAVSQTALHESTNLFATGRRSELFVLDRRSGSGISAAAKVYFLESGTWRQVGEENRNAGSDRLDSDSALVLRNPAGVSATSLAIAGVGYHGPVVSRFATETGERGSHSVGLLQMGGALLNALGLEDTVVRQSPDFTAGNRTDVLHVFAVTQSDSPTPAKTYFRSGGNWIDVSGNTVANDAVVPQGSVLMMENVSPAVAGQSDWDQTGGSN